MTQTLIIDNIHNFIHIQHFSKETQTDLSYVHCDIDLGGETLIEVMTLPLAMDNNRVKYC